MSECSPAFAALFILLIQQIRKILSVVFHQRKDIILTGKNAVPKLVKEFLIDFIGNDRRHQMPGFQKFCHRLTVQKCLQDPDMQGI